MTQWEDQWFVVCFVCLFVVLGLRTRATSPGIVSVGCLFRPGHSAWPKLNLTPAPLLVLGCSSAFSFPLYLKNTSRMLPSTVLAFLHGRAWGTLEAQLRRHREEESRTPHLLLCLLHSLNSSYLFDIFVLFVWELFVCFLLTSRQQGVQGR